MNQKVSTVVHHQLFIPMTVGITAFTSGVCVGLILGRRHRNDTEDFPTQMKLNFDFHKEDLFDKEVLLSKGSPLKVPPAVIDANVYQDKVNVDEDEVIEEVLDIPLSEIVLADDEEIVEVTVTEIEVDIENDDETESSTDLVPRSLFANDENDEDWDYKEEVKNRNSTEPYILHKDEFYSDEMNLTQVTLTYYAGDNIMVDEDDSPIYNHSQIVGDLKFGHGSGDPSVLYVRNEKQRAEYEILLESGLYSQEVLGLEIENNARVQDIKHSNNLRFRPE